MNPRWVFKGTARSFSEIPLASITPQDCSVSLENIQHPTSFDIGRNHIVTPGYPPHWIDQELPVQLSPDPQAIDPSTILPPCPLDPMLRALSVTSPELSLKDVDIIVERKQLRTLFNFINGETVNHRIDAELIGKTLLFYVGWSGFAYGTPGVTYGMNFEKKFTTPMPEDVIHHKRVVQYNFGGLNVLTKYQVDACLTTQTNSFKETPELVSTSPAGLQTFKSGTVVPGEHVAEIKTLRLAAQQTRCPPSRRTLQQLWFSQTPILISGHHNGNGSFVAVEKRNVIQDGSLKKWEKKNEVTLRRLNKLIRMIRESIEEASAGLAEGSRKTAGIVLRSGKYAPVVSLHTFEPGYLESLPDDLRRLWN